MPPQTSHGIAIGAYIVLNWDETDENPSEVAMWLDLPEAEDLAQKLSAVLLAAKSGTFTE